MALSIFEDKSHQPNPDEVRQVLGDTAAWWNEIVTFASQTYPPITELWNHAGAKYGWSLWLKQKDRIVLYLTPQEGGFLAGVVLGEKAAQAAHDEGAPAAVLTAIDGAPKYAEGRGIRLPVSNAEDAATVQELVRLKMGK
jgi:hypothetical protein